jgi:hypothetical protein
MDKRLDAFSGIPPALPALPVPPVILSKSHSPKFPPFCKFCLKNHRRSWTRRYRGGALSHGHQEDTLHEALLLTIIIIAMNLRV